MYVYYLLGTFNVSIHCDYNKLAYLWLVSFLQHFQVSLVRFYFCSYVNENLSRRKQEEEKRERKKKKEKKREKKKENRGKWKRKEERGKKKEKEKEKKKRKRREKRKKRNEKRDVIWMIQ